MGVAYEWQVDEMDPDGSEDIVSVAHFDALKDAKTYAEALNAPIAMCLVRDVFIGIGEAEALDGRQWAYLDKTGKLPAEFDGGATIPKRFRSECDLAAS